MSDSDHTGETTLLLGGDALTLVYDWRAMSAVRTLLKGADVFQALAGADPDMLASLVAIGLARHHADWTAQKVLDASPPLIPTQSAVVKAINRAFWGAEAPPVARPPRPAPVAQAGRAQARTKTGSPRH